MKRYLGILIAIGFGLSGGEVHAATYYVSKSGNDGYSCATAQNVSTPKFTLNDAVRCLVAGDTLFVRAGTYAERLVGNIPSGTSWSNTVRIANYNGESVTMRPSGNSWVIDFNGRQQYIEINGINLDGSTAQATAVVRIIWDGGSVGTAHHIRLKNLEIIGNRTPNEGVLMNGVLATATATGAIGGNEFQYVRMHGGNAHGFYIQSPNNLVEWCEVYDILKKGISAQNANTIQTPPDNNTFRYNIVRNFTRIPESWNTNSPAATGIMVFTGRGNKVYGNLVYDIDRTSGGPPMGIDIWGSSAEVYNNTVVGVPGTGIRVATSGASGTILRNNISYGNSTNFGNSGTNTVESNNLFSTDPQFLNAGARDFRIQSGSPARDTGFNTSTTVTIDVARNTRPQGGTMDVGAYEFVTSTTTSPSAPAPPTGVRIVQN